MASIVNRFAWSVVMVVGGVSRAVEVEKPLVIPGVVRLGEDPARFRGAVALDSPEGVELCRQLVIDRAAWPAASLAVRGYQGCAVGLFGVADGRTVEATLLIPVKDKTRARMVLSALLRYWHRPADSIDGDGRKRIGGRIVVTNAEIWDPGESRQWSVVRVWWLAVRSDDLAEGIRDGRPMVGMARSELLAAMSGKTIADGAKEGDVEVLRWRIHHARTVPIGEMMPAPTGHHWGDVIEATLRGGVVAAVIDPR